VRAAALAAPVSSVRSQRVPLRARPDRVLPADSSLPGQVPAQDARHARLRTGTAPARTRPHPRTAPADPRDPGNYGDQVSKRANSASIRSSSWPT
jgi:hypothetical protein